MPVWVHMHKCMYMSTLQTRVKILYGQCNSTLEARGRKWHPKT